MAVGGCNLKHNDEITYTKSGDYDNTITVTDDAGNTSDIDIKISVIDAPSINGISDKTVTVGDTIDYLSGVTATDGKGTDITGSIEVDSSKVDINTPGTYQITYKVTDSYGFSTGANCNITVNEKKEEVADNTSDGNDNTTTSDKGNKRVLRRIKEIIVIQLLITIVLMEVLIIHQMEVQVLQIVSLMMERKHLQVLLEKL